MKVIDTFNFKESNVFVAESQQNITLVHDEQLFDIDYFRTILSEPKKLEWVNSRNLIYHGCQQLGIDFKGVFKDDFGKLRLQDSQYYISISHSKHLIAVAFAKSKKVGVDLEAITEKFHKVSPRVLNQNELSFVGNNLDLHCILWSAKEAIYKLYGKKNIDFKEQIIIENFKIKEGFANFEGVIITQNIINASFCAKRFDEIWLIVCLEKL